MSVLSQFGGGAIRQILRGSITLGSGSTSSTATINPPLLNTDKTQLRLLGWRASTTGSSADYAATLTLTNTTTVTANRPAATGTSYVNWEITEYY